MDRNKPPGIAFDDIILKELVFSRKEGFPDKFELDMNLVSNADFSPDENMLSYEMSCEVKDPEESVYAKCTMVGMFSVIEGEENMGLREYSALGAPAAIFPYIRETIASTATKAGVPPIIIPPTNLNLLSRNTGARKEDGDSSGE